MVGRIVKELAGSFINHVFVGVFQYDFGPKKHALEPRDYVNISPPAVDASH